jgi:hypothetical protein
MSSRTTFVLLCLFLLLLANLLTAIEYHDINIFQYEKFTANAPSGSGSESNSGTEKGTEKEMEKETEKGTEKEMGTGSGSGSACGDCCQAQKEVLAMNKNLDVVSTLYKNPSNAADKVLLNKLTTANKNLNDAKINLTNAKNVQSRAKDALTIACRGTLSESPTCRDRTSDYTNAGTMYTNANTDYISKMTAVTDALNAYNASPTGSAYETARTNLANAINNAKNNTCKTCTKPITDSLLSASNAATAANNEIIKKYTNLNKSNLGFYTGLLNNSKNYTAESISKAQDLQSSLNSAKQEIPVFIRKAQQAGQNLDTAVANAIEYC